MSVTFPLAPPPPQQIGNVELSLPWNGDFSILANGDIQLAFDLPGAPTATEQRVARLLYTNPRVPNPFGSGFVSSGDDIFHPDYGVGLPAKVGSMFPGSTAASQQQVMSLLPTITAAAVNGLMTDPSIAQKPAPTVSSVQDVNNPNQVNININCVALTGDIVTVPASPITGGS